MNDEILKEAFIAGRSLLRKHAVDDDLTSQVDLDSLIACYEVIYKSLEKSKSCSGDYYSLDVLMDAYWSFIKNFDHSEYAPYYARPQEFSDLFMAVWEIALRKTYWSMNFGDHCDDIRDLGLSAFTNNERLVERSDLSIKSLVDDALDFDNSVDYLTKLKKIFQDQVDCIESRIQEVEKESGK